MSLDKLNAALAAEVDALALEGRAKAPERIITGYVPPGGGRGPRYRLAGEAGEYIRMNSNSYLSLSFHPALLEAADEASQAFGVGPGAVRFIDGTSAPHTALEGAYRAVRRPPGGAHLQLRLHDGPRRRRSRCRVRTRTGLETRSTTTASSARCASPTCPSSQRAIFKHNDVADLEAQLSAVPDGTSRVVVIFDGIFSMRGDHAPLREIAARRRATRAALPRGGRHDDGRFARHRRLRRHGTRNRGALRSHGRHLRRHAREGLRRERRVRRGQPGAHRGRATEGGYLHLHQSARRSGLRGGDRGHRHR